MKTSTKNSVIFVIITALILFLLIFFNQIKLKFELQPQKSVLNQEQITVIIDAGHGGEDGGAVGINGILEKDLNLSIALKIGQILQSQNINVIYTRTEDILLYDKNVDYKNRKKALDLAARVKIAEETPNCVFVSIHMNSFSNSKYSGLQVYYSKNNPQSNELASTLQNAVRRNLQLQNNRKATEATSRIFILDRLECPAILIECGFISNPEECRILCTEIYQKQLSETISEEIKKYVEKIPKQY